MGRKRILSTRFFLPPPEYPQGMVITPPFGGHPLTMVSGVFPGEWWPRRPLASFGVCTFLSVLLSGNGDHAALC